MTIAEIGQGSKQLLDRTPKDVLVVAIILLTTSAGFGLGMLYERESNPQGQGATATTIAPRSSMASTSPTTSAAAAVVATSPTISPPPSEATSTSTTGVLVGSVNGSTYYLPSCSGVKRIKEENKVWFTSVADARTQGYTPAQNCPGL